MAGRLEKKLRIMEPNQAIDSDEKSPRFARRFLARHCSRYARRMMNKDENDYKVVFRGATISKKEAKRVSVTILFEMVGIIAIGLLLGLTNKVLVFVLSFLLALIGYFGIAQRIYK
jgi:hypothetical protein